MILALDIGYSHTKGMADGRKTIFPSLLGEVQQRHIDLGLVDAPDYQQIEVEGSQYLFGDTALRQSGMRTRRQDRGWIETPEYKALALCAVSELTKGSVTVQLATGLPIAYYADRAKLVDRLKGAHTIKRAGRRQQRIEITDILVLPQAMSAVLSEALDEQGKVRPGPISEGVVGLIDIGGHTCGISTFKELEEITRQTASIDAGMWGVLKEIGKVLNEAYPGLSLQDYDVVEATTQGYLFYYGERRDITELTRRPLHLFARRILGEASQVWGNAARLDALLLAGGGAEIVGPAFQSEYPHTRIVTEPQWANCQGYLKFARRHWL